MTWQLQEAKNKFSEVVETSLQSGPQIISRRGRNTAVVISYADYKRFMAPKKSLKSVLRLAHLEELDLTRDASESGRASEFQL